MTNLRRLARGQQCQVRLPGCDGGGETTVLAHYRLAGTCGVGMKPPDRQAAWCCFKCHELADGRRQERGLTREAIRLAFAEGVLRTLNEIDKLGEL